jgi:ABC-2 type transport system permease protein
VTTLTRVLALFWKELLALWKDPRGRMSILIPPLVQGLVFGYAATFDLANVPIAVYDQDRSEPARELIARFTGASTFREVARLSRDEEIAQYIDSQRATLVIRIGPDFGRDLLAGRGAKVQLAVDGRNSNTALIAVNYVAGIVQDFNERWRRDHGQGGIPARLEVRSWFNPNLESRWFIMPGLVGTITLILSTLVTALSLAREREEGTFDQLLVTPLRPIEILIGKVLPGLVVGLVGATILVLVATLWFRVPLIGSLLLLYLGTLLYLLSSVGTGLMISSFSRTQQQALLGAFLFVVPSVILSGFATPLANMPEAVQYVTYANPLRYFLVVSRGVFLQDLTPAELWPQLWPMALIGVITMAVATWLFRSRLQ